MPKSLLFSVFTIIAITNLSVLHAEKISKEQLMQGYDLHQKPYWRVKEGLVDPASIEAEIKNGKTPCSSDDWFIEKVGRTATPAGIGKEGLVTYCRVFDLNEVPDAPLALNLSEIDDRDIAFVNGVSIGSTGNFDDSNAQAYDKTRLYLFASQLLQPGQNVILVHVSGFSLANPWGMINERTSIGPAKLITRLYDQVNYTQLFFLTVYATVGSYFFFLFLTRRRDRENLFFGLFAVALVLYQFLRTQIKYDVFDSFLELKRIEYIVLTTLAPLLFFFFRFYFRETKRIAKIILNIGSVILIAISVIGIVIYLLTDSPMEWSAYNQSFYLLGSMPVTFVLVLGILIHRLIKKDIDAIIMISGILALVGATVVDSLSTFGLLNVVRLAPYAFFIFVMDLALILAYRFVRLHAEVEDLNQNLSQKVEERTNELKKSLDEVQALKAKQDGDYFLTSLLIQPLARVAVADREVSIDAFTKQKKAFTFNHRDIEIGGDISIAERISLATNSYVAFFNADAMGKSIQGAGGALVIGTVFRALLERTQTIDEFRNLPPELWLKETYREIQAVFSTFNGSMLISASVGLIDEKRGILYSFNAGHTLMALYRDGKASFVEGDPMFQKFGIDIILEPFSVLVYQLQPGDTIVIGSDGRDDLLIDGEINYDEYLFLNHIERGKGKAADIAQELINTGKLTDDLSLLCLHYTGSQSKPKPIEELSAMKQEVQHLINLRQHEEALTLLQSITQTDPTDTDTLFWLSYLQAKTARRRKQFEEAVQTAERVHIRNPKDERNLRHLKACYHKLGSSLEHSIDAELEVLTPLQENP